MNANLNPEKSNLSPQELDIERALRPLSFDDFTGQEAILENLKIFVKAANLRGEALDHTLFHGPPGLGKTTLANILANELGVGIKIPSGPVLDKPGDLAGLRLAHGGGRYRLGTSNLGAFRVDQPNGTNLASGAEPI